jgi:hypothetical protein
MELTSDHLLVLINGQGIETALNCIDIESITDEKTKIICRTIQTSIEILKKTLADNSINIENTNQGL